MRTLDQKNIKIQIKIRSEIVSIAKGGNHVKISFGLYKINSSLLATFVKMKCVFRL